MISISIVLKISLNEGKEIIVFFQSFWNFLSLDCKTQYFVPISNYNIYFLMRIRRWSLTNEVPTCAPHQIDLKFIECWDKIFQLMRGFYWAFIDTALAIVLQAPLDSINTLWTDVGLMWTLDQHSTTSTVHVIRPGINYKNLPRFFFISCVDFHFRGQPLWFAK